ncbi:MAG: translation elongation factor 4 [Armatimonadota bacterium]
MSLDPQSHIRNFCIIAHIDHGKSTLADRILEVTGAVDPRHMHEQMLDQMDLERERGITIKMATVRLHYTALDGQTYQVNLIDTPGHVDFAYEVSRSLAACEGAILVVDSTQGVEAQTIANVNLAMNANLTIIPVINKIDLPAADIDRAAEEIEDVLMIDATEAIACSAKTGVGIKDILEAIITRVPAPSGRPEAPLRALVFDSHFDAYLGVVTYLRVIDGSVKPGDMVRCMGTGKEFEVTGVGTFQPKMLASDQLSCGEVGYLVASMKTVGDVNVGDTLTNAEFPAKRPLPGYKPVLPMVFCGLFPMDGENFNELRDALEKLQLNDASLIFEAESSAALGFGFRCGFLGLLHMDIVQERLEREFGISLIATAPSVSYRVMKTDGEFTTIDNPAHWPASTLIEYVEEPFIRANIYVPKEYVGPMMDLTIERRGEFIKMEYPTPKRVMLTYNLPLSEILLDFYDQLKSRSKGYASFDYDPIGYMRSELVKLDIMINGDTVDALSFITHRDRAFNRGKALVERLRTVVPKQQFEVRLQAAIGAKVIAAEKVSALRKNVIAKCYGGDISRKRKLLEKQKEGKKRMKQVGSVELPQEAFLSVLKVAES